MSMCEGGSMVLWSWSVFFKSEDMESADIGSLGKPLMFAIPTDFFSIHCGIFDVLFVGMSIWFGAA